MGHGIGSAEWLQERFPEKDWHRHRRTDGRTDICDGTPSDCPSKPRLPLEADDDFTLVEKARLDAVMRMLVDSGDMTPMAVRQIKLSLGLESAVVEL